MPLGTKVDLSPGHIVLDGDPALPRKGHSSPLPSFRHMAVVATVAHLSYCSAFVTNAIFHIPLGFGVAFVSACIIMSAYI